MASRGLRCHPVVVLGTASLSLASSPLWPLARKALEGEGGGSTDQSTGTAPPHLPSLPPTSFLSSPPFLPPCFHPVVRVHVGTHALGSSAQACGLATGPGCARHVLPCVSAAWSPCTHVRSRLPPAQPHGASFAPAQAGSTLGTHLALQGQTAAKNHSPGCWHSRHHWGQSGNPSSSRCPGEQVKSDVGRSGTRGCPAQGWW